MPTCLIGLGSNLGDRRQALDGAVERLRQQAHIRLTGQSRWHETAPVGGPPGQGAFLNGAALLETSLGAEALLALLQRIEAELGRRRRRRWGPRRLDLDLLLYDDLVLETPALTLPHPRMAWRRFVLEPAAEVAPAMLHPTTGWTIARLLDHLNTAVPYVAIAGPIAVGKTRLAEELAQKTSVYWIAEEVAPRRLKTFYADPSSNAWAVELEFLNERARLLAADLPRWSEAGRLWVSDFWFPQGLAYAGVWLPPVRLGVVEPKLTVLLDAPPERLAGRVRRRGRQGEDRLTQQRLERIRRAILREANRPGQGPLLRLAEDDPERILTEVLAAAEAMK
jgi:2-amino-4-hydroxy-6-hydroxymethyldihydropteridine diphosphokinase